MLLCILDIGGTTRKVSTEEISSLESPYYAEVHRAPNIKKAIEKDYGGFVKLTWGKISFIPTTFQETTWPPPASIGLTVKYTDTTEAAAKTLFEGNLHLEKIEQGSITYGMWADTDDTTVEGRVFDDTLSVEFADACTTLGLTSDVTKARGTSPGVDYTQSGNLIDLLSDITAAFTHFFYKDGTTLHLVDMLTTLTTYDITEFDTEPVEYYYNLPYTLFASGEYGRIGAYGYGKEFTCNPQVHETQSNVEDYIDDIITIIERPKIRISVPINGTTSLFKMGDKVTLTDETQAITSWLMVRSIQYDFNSSFITVEGDGGIS